MFRWVKEAGLETADLQHLKRIRRSDTQSTLLLSGISSRPAIPESFNLAEPYICRVPANAALTLEELKANALIWPTTYAPRRKGEPDPWSRAKAAWAWEAVDVLLSEAERARVIGEVIANKDNNIYPQV